MVLNEASRRLFCVTWTPCLLHVSRAMRLPNLICLHRFGKNLKDADASSARMHKNCYVCVTIPTQSNTIHHGVSRTKNPPFRNRTSKSMRRCRATCPHITTPQPWRVARSSCGRSKSPKPSKRWVHKSLLSTLKNTFSRSLFKYPAFALA